MDIGSDDYEIFRIACENGMNPACGDCAHWDRQHKMLIPVYGKFGQETGEWAEAAPCRANACAEPDAGPVFCLMPEAGICFYPPEANMPYDECRWTPTLDFRDELRKVKAVNDRRYAWETWHCNDPL